MAPYGESWSRSRKEIISPPQHWWFNRMISRCSQNSGCAVRSIDFNPNKQYHLCAGADDGSLAVWDSRQAAQPLSWGRYHSHWVWSVRYNTFHDQLILSAGSDSRVLLLSQVPVFSSFPLCSLSDRLTSTPYGTVPFFFFLIVNLLSIPSTGTGTY